MKKAIMKAWGLVLVLCLAVVLAGCGNSAQDAIDAKATVTAFMDAIISLELDEAAQYIDDPDAIEEMGLKNVSITAMNEVFAGNPSLEPYKEKFTPIIDKAIEKVVAVCSYEIVGEQETGSDFVYTINLTAPNDSTKAEQYMTDALEQYTTEDSIMEIVMEMLENGTISLSSTEDEIMTATFDMLVPKVVEIMDEITFETETTEVEVTVSKTEGKWLINSSKTKI